MSIVQNTISGLLKNIYVLDEGKNSSVFLEFNSSKSVEMKRACKNASKSWELCQDQRVPVEANEKFCYGFTVKRDQINEAGINSANDLVKRTVYWLRNDWNSGVLEVDSNIPRIFVTASELKEMAKKMPAKNYDKIYEIDGQTYVPIHMIKKN